MVVFFVKAGWCSVGGVDVSAASFTIVVVGSVAGTISNSWLSSITLSRIRISLQSFTIVFAFGLKPQLSDTVAVSSSIITLKQELHADSMRIACKRSRIGKRFNVIHDYCNLFVFCKTCNLAQPVNRIPDIVDV
nr:hypothetical protein [Tanacetum cinerariifolium]